jgi:hypothetical protein
LNPSAALSFAIKAQVLAVDIEQLGNGRLDAEKHDCCLTLQATTKSHGTKQS